MIFDALEVSHWAFLVSGLGFGVAVGVSLAVLVRRQGSAEREELDERLHLIESRLMLVLEGVVALQDVLAKQCAPKEKRPLKWTVGGHEIVP